VSRQVLLIDIGADALPVVTPAPAQLGTWMPVPFVPPPLAVPTGFAVTPLLDAVLLTWNATVEDANYLIERAPDVAGAPGAWGYIGQTTDLRYTAAVAGGVPYWWRVKSEVLARRSAATAAIKAAPGTIGGSGTNILPDPYSTFERATLPQIVNPAGLGLSRDAATKMIAAALRVTGGVGTLYLGPAFNLQLTPGKKYLLSFWMRAAAAGHLITPFIEVNGAVYFYGAQQATAAANVYERKSVVLDLSGNLQVSGWLGFSKGTAGDLLLDGIMLEELVGTTSVPSAYTRGRADGVAFEALVAAQAAQATADGQIDIYRQSNAPSIGGAGAKLGDYWQDSDDGRWWYCNGSSWVESPDNRLPQAVLDAAAANSAAGAAQATANTKARVHISETQPTGGTYSVGDFWFQPSTKLTRYYNGSGWSLQSEFRPARPSGRELIPNPTFTSRLQGGANPAVGANNNAKTGILVDGWYVTPPTDYTHWEFPLETSGVMFRLKSFTNLPNSTQKTATLRSDLFPVDPGSKLKLSAQVNSAWLSSNFPAGTTALIRFFVEYSTTGDPANINDANTVNLDVYRTDAAIKNLLMTAPADARSARVSMVAFYVNLSGAALNQGNLPWDARITLLSLVERASLDDEVDHGVTYGKTSNEDLYDTGALGYARRIGLSVKGSRKILGGARNSRASLVYGIAAVRTTGALTANSSGQVTVNAHSIEISGETVSYSTVTNAVTGLSQGQTYVIFTLDPFLDGGARTYYAQTSVLSAQQTGEGAVMVGNITIPTSGSSGGGGGGGGNPGEWCVDGDMILDCGRRARDVQAGDVIACWDGNSDQPGVILVGVESNEIERNVPSTRIVCAGGAENVASDSTPMPVPHSDALLLLPQMLGLPALARYGFGAPRWEEVVVCESAGLRDVCHIRVKQQCYFAGVMHGASIATHNPTYKP
jgi:hypothetical protein